MCALAVLLLAAAPAEKARGEFVPGRDGWLTLFDGSDLAEWEKSRGADWALRDGVLAGTRGEIANAWHWTDFELAAVCRGRGALRFRVSVAPMPDQPGYLLALTHGTLRRADGRVVQAGSGSHVEGWRQVRLIVSRGKFTVYLDGHKAAEAADRTHPAMGYLAFVAEGQPLAVKLLRVRPLNREEHINVPAPDSACYVCHANFEDEEISSRHASEKRGEPGKYLKPEADRPDKSGCAGCHGPSLAHRSDEDNVTAPDVMYSRGEVEPACLQCHTRHKAKKKRKDGKEPPPRNPVCTDCHGTHRASN